MKDRPILGEHLFCCHPVSEAFCQGHTGYFCERQYPRLRRVSKKQDIDGRTATPSRVR